MTGVWVAVWHHRHGVDVAAFDHEPTEQEATDLFDSLADFEPERGESVEVRGPLPLNTK